MSTVKSTSPKSHIRYAKITYSFTATAIENKLAITHTHKELCVQCKFGSSIKSDKKKDMV